ncbi:MAG TPA: HAMP domain-containing sensor histidine kinase [Candidatus Eisenbacteria bacterium]|nr:HAMP domain-containing sensor histidine kinase [Candidatus Eisenbacteria bacterium]
MKGVRLHWKILFATVLPLLALTSAVLWTVNQSITEQAERNVREDLIRAASIFEDMLGARSEELAIAGQVIVQDPKFFSILTLPGSATDPQVRATAEGVAADFNAITRADLFVVFDAKGRVVADASRDRLGASASQGLHGVPDDAHPRSGILADGGRHFQIAEIPVLAGPRRVGLLLLGAGIGQDLAERLRTLTRSEVTFVSNGTLTGSTLEASSDRHALASTLSSGRSPVRDSKRGPSDAEVFTFAGATSQYVTVAGPIRGSAPGEGQLFAIQRSLATETAFLSRMRTALLELGLLGAVLSIALGYVISRSITAPVRTLVRGAEEMERGNYDYPLQVKSLDEIGYLAIRFRDMRQRQRVYVKSLEEVARLKGDFIDVASLELRTPLSVLKGFLELLSLERLGPLTPHQKEAVSAMEGGVSALTRIAEDAWRVSQIQSRRLVLETGAHDVGTILEEGVGRARVAGRGRRVEIRMEHPSGIPPLLIDGTRLTEAVAHLVSNGVRFTPDGGSVTASAALEGSDLLIHVADTGQGIAEDRLEKLLDRSFTFRDTLNHHSSSTLEFGSEGLGLGIPIARGVAEAHGGSLTARSRPGAGSVFTLRIPAKPAFEREEAAA